MLNQAHFAPDEKRLLARFWRSASGYWRGQGGWRAWLLVIVLIATVILQLLTQYGLNYWNRDFFDAVGRRDAAGLWTEALRFVPLAMASLALTVFSVWGRMTMQRTWRAWLSNHLYDYWLKDDRYVRLRFVAGDYDSPEFRIAEDARIATDLPVDLVVGLLQSLLNAVMFIGILWSVGDSLSIELGGFVLNIPGYLVIAVVVYSALLSAAIVLIAHHLTRVMEENKRTEAELRSMGTHLRESGEGTALPDGRKDPRHVIGAALRGVIAIWRIYMWQLMRMTVVTYSSLLVTPVIGLLLCTPKYLMGTMSLGEVVQAAAAFVVVQTAFNWFTDNFAKLAEWASSANRVASLLLALDEVDQPVTGGAAIRGDRPGGQQSPGSPSRDR
jgi:vitamin B12/bleomycin/antimicrobial peptide transport system ATP-binding/permease protein